MATPASAVSIERLTETWETPSTLAGRLTSVDHKIIGKRYLVTAFVFLLLGGLEALLMRWQLARPGQELLSAEVYNQLFSMHGTTMIWWYAAPILSGFSNYLFPLMLGSRDMAFPRLNALSYWIFLVSGIFLYSSFLVGQLPDAGWFAYVPLTSAEHSPGPGMDFYALGILLLTISTTAGAINFIVTAFKMRSPGMSIGRMPLFIWGTLTVSVVNLVALPALSAACVFLWLDRTFGMQFFDVMAGGNALLWQHLFWIFGHPWVYVIVLPAMSMVHMIIPTFSRRPIVGHTILALSTVATGILGFGVWVHHMFATGLPPLSMTFFSAASLTIVIPSAVAVFCWIATIWFGRPVLKVPMMYMFGFLSLFVIGGVSGVVTASIPFDWQVTDTYFVVAHLHYVLLGINLFPVIGGFYYWLPKITGRMMSERLGKLSFWLLFLGINVTFFPMHVTGILGMPRRIYTYPDGLGWNTVNLLSTIGAFVLAAGVLIFLVDVFRSLRRGEAAGANPWDASSLEWSVPSPAPAFNFARIPLVGSRDPLWEERLGMGRRSDLRGGPVLEEEHHETLAVHSMDGVESAILEMPEPSPWPFLLSVALLAGFYGLLATSWTLAAIGGAGCAACIAAWLWPTGPAQERNREEAATAGVAA